ncbi:MAG: hypothetical protein WEA76_04735 [Acidimicrobiia bacterium]
MNRRIAVVAAVDCDFAGGDHRASCSLDIPNAPGVANVSELVTLTVSFVAAPTA